MISITKTQLEIIKFLLNQKEPESIRSLARKLKKSYALVYNNLDDLHKKGIVIKQDLPPTQIITLNRDAADEYLIEAEIRRTDDFYSKNKWMQVFVKDVLDKNSTTFFILLMFGSYVQGKETKNSDLDLLAVVPRKEDIPFMEEAIGKSYTKVKKQVVAVEEKDFLEMIHNNQQFNVGNEAAKHHLILAGFEQFYHLLKRARK
jgi:predicted nucleotidyltransferase/biotin operon repressor